MQKCWDGGSGSPIRRRNALYRAVTIWSRDWLPAGHGLTRGVQGRMWPLWQCAFWPLCVNQM
jgi:hypothetical protein